MKNKLQQFKLGDFLIFAAILALAAGIWARFAFLQADTVYGEIWKDGELYERVKLDEDYHTTITVKGETVTNVIEIDGLRMRVAQADCHDHVCVNSGWIERTGQVAVCLPNKLEIKITGGQASDVDAVVG
ncbi:MAG: NusG domain II-containing protein [Butyricicoccaceae bacterium]